MILYALCCYLSSSKNACFLLKCPIIKLLHIFSDFIAQANFLKNWAGLGWLLQCFGDTSVTALEKAEMIHPDIKPFHFRGAEGLIPPDLETLLL